MKLSYTTYSICRYKYIFNNCKENVKCYVPFDINQAFELSYIKERRCILIVKQIKRKETHQVQIMNLEWGESIETNTEMIKRLIFR